MEKTDSQGELSASEHISNQIAELADWRGELYARLRRVLQQAAPGLVEEWKWGTGVWSQNGNVVSIGAFKDHLKVNFFKGAAVNDPRGLFNAGQEAKASRSIDLFEGSKIDEAALADLIRGAVAMNTSGGKK